MKTLVLRAPDVVSNSKDFKKLGHSNIGYTADLANVDPTKPAIFGFQMGETPIHVTIEGAIMYKVTGGVIDFANPSDGFLTWDVNLSGSFVGFAFVPTYETGYIRIRSKGEAIYTFYGAYTANDSIRILIEPREFKNIVTFFYDYPHVLPAGYVLKFTLTGDVNGFSESSQLVTFSIPLSATQLSTTFSGDKWIKPLPATFQNFSIYASTLSVYIDLAIFNETTPIGVRIGSSLGVKVVGNINHLLSVSKTVGILGNYSQEGITGSINSIATNFEQINIHAPNLAGGYTTRTFTMSIVNLRINAPKVPAGDWDLLLSDLATKAPALAGGVLQVNKRTAASDAHVLTLTNKGVSVIIGF